MESVSKFLVHRNNWESFTQRSNSCSWTASSSSSGEWDILGMVGVYSKQKMKAAGWASLGIWAIRLRIVRLFLKESSVLFLSFLPWLQSSAAFIQCMVPVVSLKAHGHLRIKCNQFYLIADWCGHRDEVFVPQSGSKDWSLEYGRL